MHFDIVKNFSSPEPHGQFQPNVGEGDSKFVQKKTLTFARLDYREIV